MGASNLSKKMSYHTGRHCPYHMTYTKLHFYHHSTVNEFDSEHHLTIDFKKVSMSYVRELNTTT